MIEGEKLKYHKEDEGKIFATLYVLLRSAAPVNIGANK
jgi:hypothetical protein